MITFPDRDLPMPNTVRAKVTIGQAPESDTLIFSPTASVSAITLTDAGVEIAKLRNDGAAEFNWPAIEIAAAKWNAGSRDARVSMARLLVLANNSAPTEYDAVAAERERCATAVDHILREGGGTWGDAVRLGPIGAGNRLAEGESG